ncbi:MAG: 16S rRNA (uracil(1498)-N(3))-methyltransferase [Firmicutes bacterium]|nr:16S rRNA (uracil(1498)-N(3))-methyltransferase [Bacillota bacterium]
MHRFFADKIKSGAGIRLTGENARHARDVLRLKPGDKLIVCDGSEGEYLCEIEKVDKEAVACRVLDFSRSATEPETKIFVYAALPKNDKLELVTEKCTELGFYGLCVMESSRCVAKAGDKAEKKLSRLKRVAESAAKQSGRGVIPSVEGIMSFEEAIKSAAECSLALIPYEKERESSLRSALLSCGSPESIALLIGPEGGFSEEEIERAKSAGIIPVSLGNRILRTETAPIAAVAAILYELDWNK